MNRTNISDNIIHIEFDTREELCSTMVRMQEFYESPFPEIRGTVFTLEQFKTLYASSKEHGEYSYNTDWCGFNIPGHVIKEFSERFIVLSDQESEFLKLILFNMIHQDKFYVIATHKDDDYSDETIDHEIAHALYYLNNAYARMMYQEVTKIDSHIFNGFVDQLIEMGYSYENVVDEIQAHLATDTEPFLLQGVDPTRFQTAFKFFKSYPKYPGF